MFARRNSVRQSQRGFAGEGVKPARQAMARRQQALAARSVRVQVCGGGEWR